MGGCAGILPLNAEGRCNRKVPTVYAHSGKLNLKLVLLQKMLSLTKFSLSAALTAQFNTINQVLLHTYTLILLHRLVLEGCNPQSC